MNFFSFNESLGDLFVWLQLIGDRDVHDDDEVDEADDSDDE